MIDFDAGDVVEGHLHQLGGALGGADAAESGGGDALGAVSGGGHLEAAEGHRDVGAGRSREGHRVAIAIAVLLEIDAGEELQRVRDTAVTDESEVINRHDALQVRGVPLAVDREFRGAHLLFHVHLEGVERDNLDRMQLEVRHGLVAGLNHGDLVGVLHSGVDCLDGHRTGRQAHEVVGT